MWKFEPKGKLAFNCSKEERDGVNFIRCSPIEKKDDIKQALTDKPVLFKVKSNGKLELIDDGGIDTKTIKELDEYLGYFTGGTEKPSENIEKD